MDDNENERCSLDIWLKAFNPAHRTRKENRATEVTLFHRILSPSEIARMYRRKKQSLSIRIKVWFRDRWVGLCRFLLAVMDFSLYEWLEEQANTDEWVADRHNRLY